MKGVDICAHPGCADEPVRFIRQCVRIERGVYRPTGSKLAYCSKHALAEGESEETDKKFLSDRQLATIANNWEVSDE